MAGTKTTLFGALHYLINGLYTEAVTPVDPSGQPTATPTASGGLLSFLAQLAGLGPQRIRAVVIVDPITGEPVSVGGGGGGSSSVQSFARDGDNIKLVTSTATYTIPGTFADVKLVGSQITGVSGGTLTVLLSQDQDGPSVVVTLPILDVTLPTLSGTVAAATIAAGDTVLIALRKLQSSVTANAAAIAARVLQTDYDAYKTSNDSSVAGKVAQSDYNTNKTATDNAIAARVLQSDYNTNKTNTDNAIAARLLTSTYNGDKSAQATRDSDQDTAIGGKAALATSGTPADVGPASLGNSSLASPANHVHDHGDQSARTALTHHSGVQVKVTARAGNTETEAQTALNNSLTKGSASETKSGPLGLGSTLNVASTGTFGDQTVHTGGLRGAAALVGPVLEGLTNLGTWGSAGVTGYYPVDAMWQNRLGSARRRGFGISATGSTAGINNVNTLDLLTSSNSATGVAIGSNLTGVVTYTASGTANFDSGQANNYLGAVLAVPVTATGTLTFEYSNDGGTTYTQLGAQIALTGAARPKLYMSTAAADIRASTQIRFTVANTNTVTITIAQLGQYTIVMRDESLLTINGGVITGLLRRLVTAATAHYPDVFGMGGVVNWDEGQDASGNRTYRRYSGGSASNWLVVNLASGLATFANSIISGGYLGLTPIAASSVPINALFVDSSDSGLKFKNSAGTVRTVTVV